MSIGNAIYSMRRQRVEERFDVSLPYGNKLVFLRRGSSLAVRLLLIIEGRRTFVTPSLPLSRQELEALLTGTYATIDLGAVKLSTEPREMIIGFGYRRIPVSNAIWQPVAELARNQSMGF